MTSPRRALVLVDVQLDYFDGGPLEIQYPPHRESLPQITRAIDTATAAGIPVIAVQHSSGAQAPVFNPTLPGFRLHPEVERRRTDDWIGVVKRFGTVFAGTGLADRLREWDVDTVTLVGYMTNNCILASAAEAETHGLTAEVLSDATGAIHLAHDRGFADARTVHTTLMTILHSNLAAVAGTDDWIAAVEAGAALPISNLGAAAMAGAARASEDALAG